MEQVPTPPEDLTHKSLKLSTYADPNHHTRALLYGIGAFLIMIIALVVGYYLGTENKSSQVAGASTNIYQTP